MRHRKRSRAAPAASGAFAAGGAGARALGRRRKIERGGDEKGRRAGDRQPAAEKGHRLRLLQNLAGAVEAQPLQPRRAIDRQGFSELAKPPGRRAGGGGRLREHLGELRQRRRAKKAQDGFAGQNRLPRRLGMAAAKRHERRIGGQARGERAQRLRGVLSAGPGLEADLGHGRFGSGDVGLASEPARRSRFREGYIEGSDFKQKLINYP